jgi:hypothetical protein
VSKFFLQREAELPSDRKVGTRKLSRAIMMDRKQHVRRLVTLTSSH